MLSWHESAWAVDGEVPEDSQEGWREAAEPAGQFNGFLVIATDNGKARTSLLPSNCNLPVYKATFIGLKEKTL